MIPVREMLNDAVWLDWAAAYRVCMVVRSHSKLTVITMPNRNEEDGYINVIFDGPGTAGTGSVMKMGLVAALCARHDLPADTVDKFTGERVQFGPRFEDYPYFADGLPKDRSQAHIAGPVHSVGVR